MKHLYLLITSIIILSSVCLQAKGQVQIRDTTITWTTHSFQLNEDYSMASYSTADNSRQRLTFAGKVLENELIRLVLLPEYGGRVLSMVYKPTMHEYLYQSECGSPYGMGDGNFYYDWLMVYGGIFPTFPEPEHGKSWLLPWSFEIVHSSSDSVLIAMEYTDNQSYSKAPGKFNNGTTGITCRVGIGVYRASSLWDYTVSLKNNKTERVKYEYWTCTTLTPGSEIGNTGAPLNTKLVVPIEKYEAAWSPGSWIGSYGRTYNYSRIDELSKWQNMGIAYAHDLQSNFWGVINGENNEGIFRISENDLTPGLKFWTWGKNNIDNNLFDFSNGGADNYIELWAGVSEAFFEDAHLQPEEELSWTESYVPTVKLTSATKMNQELALNLAFDTDVETLSWDLFDFKPGRQLFVRVYLSGENYYTLSNKHVISEPLGNSLDLTLFNIPSGVYTANLEVYDELDKLLIQDSKEISRINTGLRDVEQADSPTSAFIVENLDKNKFRCLLPESDAYELEMYNLAGQLLGTKSFTGTATNIEIPIQGIAVVVIKGSTRSYSRKIQTF